MYNERIENREKKRVREKQEGTESKYDKNVGSEGEGVLELYANFKVKFGQINV